MAGKYLIVATEDELELPWSEALRPRGVVGSDRVIVTGVGGTNVIRALKDLPRDSQIYNVGWAGSVHYPVGSVLHIGATRLWHPNVDFLEETFELGNHDTLCLTAGDFVLDGADLPEKSVVDMELAYIAAFGFASVMSIKYVSDALNLRQYNERR